MIENKLNELRRLIASLLDGELDPESSALLSEMLASDADARREYLRLLTIHSDLLYLPPQSGKAGASPSRLRPSAYGIMLGGLIGLAASFAIVALSGLLTNDAGRANAVADGDEAAAQPAGPAETAVARIIRKIDCDSQADRWSVNTGPSIKAGETLLMQRGLMELKFRRGAVVTLEAPVSFTIESDMHAVLSYGKITAEVPQTARGFKVTTPRGEAIDLGTRFGVYVKQNGDTETHVFEGEVIVKPSDGIERADALSLTDSMAYAVSTLKDSKSFNATPQRFAKVNFDGDGELKLAPAVDRRLKLWYSADGRVQFDELDRVLAWGDLRSDSNAACEDAWQVAGDARPTWVRDSMGGQPALRFNGRSRLVIQPFPLGSSMSAAVVYRADIAGFQASPMHPQSGRQLFNTNGPPHLVLAIDSKNRFFTRMHTGYRPDASGEWRFLNVGEMQYEAPVSDAPTVAVSVYDSANDSARLYVNGEMVGETKAPKLDTTNTPRYIGSHYELADTYFIGDLAELMLYETGLTQDEALTLSSSLMKKYRVGTED